MAAACDRLVAPAVTDPRERNVHRRLVAILLASPFPLAGLVSQVSYGAVDDGTLLAIVCAIFAAAWMATGIVAATAKTAIVQALFLVVSTSIIGFSISTAGLLQSPLVLLLLAPPFECWWLHRARGPSNKGWWASVGAVAVAVALLSSGDNAGIVREFSAELWIIPLLYAVTMWIRCAGPRPTVGSTSPGWADACDLAARISGATIFDVDADGEVLDSTRHARTTFGVPRTLLMGRGLFERIHVTDRVRYMSILADVRTDGMRRFADLRVRQPSIPGPSGGANYRPLRFEFARRPDDAGFVVMLVRNDAEIAELRSAMARARGRADITETAKIRFLASVGHELRTPLNAIIGFADMLQNEMFGPFPDPRQKKYAELIGQSGNHLLSVVNAILDVSKIESGNYPIEPEPFAFRDALDMCHSMMVLQAATRKISIVRDIDKSVGEILADRRAVRQMLINLVSNAIKFTPQGGRILIGADVKNGRLRFRVSDNGIGISAEDLERIGRPFMQVRNDHTRRYEGTGLGLSLVKGLVALHEGDMHIDSAPNCGTTVSIGLPVDGSSIPAAGSEPASTDISELNPGVGTNEAARKQA